jgi:hypothetical protein
LKTLAEINKTDELLHPFLNYALVWNVVHRTGFSGISAQSLALDKLPT